MYSKIWGYNLKTLIIHLKGLPLDQLQQINAIETWSIDQYFGL